MTLWYGTIGTNVISAILPEGKIPSDQFVSNWAKMDVQNWRTLRPYERQGSCSIPGCPNLPVHRCNDILDLCRDHYEEVK